MSWSMRDLLLRGGPWEVLPDDRAKVEAAARKWANDERLSTREREYIRRIWLARDEPEPEPEAAVFVFPDDPGGAA